MLSERETEVIKLQAQIDRLAYELGQQRSAPSREQLERSIHEASSQILSFDREAGMLLGRLLDGPIRFVPYQQFGCNKVVLRAEFAYGSSKYFRGSYTNACCDGRAMRQQNSSSQLQLQWICLRCPAPSDMPCARVNWLMKAAPMKTWPRSWAVL